MTAHHSTAGRFLAAERGAFDSEDSPEVERQPIPRGRLIERLSAESLAELAAFCGLGVAELVARAGGMLHG
jgi:hypothetical protein